MWIIAAVLLVWALFRWCYDTAAISVFIVSVFALVPLTIPWATEVDRYEQAHTEFWDAVDDKIEASQVIDALPSCTPEWQIMMTKRIQINMRLDEAQERMHEAAFCGVQRVWCPWCDCEE